MKKIIILTVLIVFLAGCAQNNIITEKFQLDDVDMTNNTATVIKNTATKEAEMKVVLTFPEKMMIMGTSFTADFYCSLSKFYFNETAGRAFYTLANPSKSYEDSEDKKVYDSLRGYKLKKIELDIFVDETNEKISSCNITEEKIDTHIYKEYTAIYEIKIS